MVIDEQDHARIGAAVSDAERRTSIELKLVFAPAASRYGAFALIYPGLFVLLVGCVLAFGWPGTSARAMLLLEAASFAVACALLQISSLRRALVPSWIKRKAAFRSARLQFARLGLDTAAGRPALLFFVSSAEHYVEILVDARVASRIRQEKFDSIVATFTQTARTGRLADAFVAACASIGDALSGPFPAQPGERNERSDELDVVDPG